MPASVPAVVRPELLVWAREASGYSIDEAAHKLGFKDGSKLADAEQGRSQLTLAKLRDAARVYKRPLAAFFLPHPPAPEPLARDFRRLTADESVEISPTLRLELRRARRRREIALRLLAESGIEPKPFTLHAEVTEDPEMVASKAREWLEASLTPIPPKTAEAALAGWIERIEARDILVCQVSRIPVRMMRGCSISGDRLPIIILNGADAATARIFTLMHELVHLMIREGGVCGLVAATSTSVENDSGVEGFCNRVAGAILLPGNTLLQDAEGLSRVHEGEAAESEIASIASAHFVSREVVVIRLAELNMVPRSFVNRKLGEYRAAYVSPPSETSRPTGGPPYTVLAIRNNGRRFSQLVLGALERKQISIKDASDYLDVKARHFAEMADRLGL